jgi:hypothetical protein
MYISDAISKIETFITQNNLSMTDQEDLRSLISLSLELINERKMTNF